MALLCRCRKTVQSVHYNSRFLWFRFDIRVRSMTRNLLCTLHEASGFPDQIQHAPPPPPPPETILMVGVRNFDTSIQLYFPHLLPR